MMPSRALKSLIAFAAVSLAAACLTAPDAPGPTAITVSNLTQSTCTHILGGGVSCTLALDIALSNAAIGDTIVTIATDDTLFQQWGISAHGPAVNYTFPKSRLARTDTGCLKPQTTITIYEGTAVGGPIIASAKVGPYTLTCS